jgi:hypothetical protein
MWKKRGNVLVCSEEVLGYPSKKWGGKENGSLVESKGYKKREKTYSSMNRNSHIEDSHKSTASKQQYTRKVH